MRPRNREGAWDIRTPTGQELPAEEVLDHGSQRKRGEEAEPAHNQRGCDQQRSEQWPVGWNGVFRFLALDLAGQKSGECKRRNRQGKAAHHHHESRREIVESGVHIQARKAGASRTMD